MPSVNEKLRDAAISHAIDLSKYSNGVVSRLIALLNRTDADLFTQLLAAMERLPAESFTIDRLDTLLNAVRIVNARAHEELGQELRKELQNLTEYESGYQFDLFRASIPEIVPVSQITANAAYTAAMSRPFQGRLLAEWMAGIEADKAARIRDAVRIGYLEGQTTSQIMQRVRGTRAKGYADGIIEIDRRNLASVIRTAIGHTSATTRETFHRENGDVIKALSWSATLDSRTSTTCSLRDGKQYTATAPHKPIGHKLPWLGGPGKAHWGCRSCEVPVTKSFRELGIDIDEVPPSERASMDGQVPADTTFGEWLKKQSAERQDQVLGPTRGKLMREGGLTIDKFATEKGDWLTLDQLRERDARAFVRAGI
jgi:hypothetical protein